MNNQRRLLVVSGPSGVGKDTVVGALLRQHPEIELSVSATTRAPRAGELEGIHYQFVTHQLFEQYIREGALLEYTSYLDQYYGTPKSEVDRRIQNGITCVLVIEVEGAKNIKRLYPGCTTVFILPPSEEELARRLQLRGSESEERMQKRLAVAAREMRLAGEYDYQLINHEPEACAEELYALLQLRQREE